MLALTLALLLADPAKPGGEFNKVLAPGAAAPAWQDLAGTDGQKHALADLKDKAAVVVVFTCNSCPVAVAYEDRVVALAKKYEAQNVAVVAINVNLLPADSLAKMTERAKKQNYPFAYLFDPTQAIAKQYGAVYTPEFFVLDKDRKIAYLGALDEQSPPRDAGAAHVEAALDALLAGKAVPKAETLGRGCRIRYTRATEK